jgi:hypothetical protein
VEWIEERLTAGTCEVTGLPFGNVDSGHDPRAPSIDRLDSSLGYTPDNCRLVVWVYNRAKFIWTDAVILEMARALVARHGN